MSFEICRDAFETGTISLDDVLVACWSAFEEGAADKSSPWWTNTLFSAGDEGANARSVTLRAVDKSRRVLTFFSDARSAKLAEMAGRVGIVTYDPVSRVQLRAYGEATVHQSDARTRDIWNSMTVWSRRAYLRDPAPGTLLDAPGPALPPLADGAAPTEANLAPAFGNFVVIDLTIGRLDWLMLTDDGNRASRFEWSGDAVSANWVVP
ncbi:MAG: hypothetical protein ACE363_06040 [Alphaproteobacteria bacterium]